MTTKFHPGLLRNPHAFAAMFGAKRNRLDTMKQEQSVVNNFTVPVKRRKTVGLFAHWFGPTPPVSPPSPVVTVKKEEKEKEESLQEPQPLPSPLLPLLPPPTLALVDTSGLCVSADSPLGSEAYEVLRSCAAAVMARLDMALARSRVRMSTLGANDDLSRLDEVKRQRDVATVQAELQRVRRKAGDRMKRLNSVALSALQEVGDEHLLERLRVSVEMVLPTKAPKVRGRRAVVTAVSGRPARPPGTPPPMCLSSLRYEFDTCGDCGCEMETIGQESSMVCPECHTLVPFIDMSGLSTSNPYVNQDHRAQPFRHKRSSKLTDFLNQLCARQKNVVPETLTVQIASILHDKMGVRTSADIRLSMVRNAMVQMNLSGMMDYAMQVYCRVVGCSPPHLSSQAEETLNVLFVLIQAPFERLKDRPSTPFFSIPYTVLTLCRYAGFGELGEFICLIKSRQSLQAQERLMMAIFEDMGWSSFPHLSREEMFQFHEEQKD